MCSQFSKSIIIGDEYESATVSRSTQRPRIRGRFFGKRAVLANAVLASIQTNSPVPCRQGNRATVRFPHDFATPDETSYSGLAKERALGMARGQAKRRITKCGTENFSAFNNEPQDLMQQDPKCLKSKT